MGDSRARARCFEDLLVWQKTRAWVAAVYQLTAEGAFAKDFGLKDQIRRAAASVSSNIAEGFERGGAKEFARYVSIAKGSCAEVRAQLYVAMDVGHLSADEANRLQEQSREIGRLLGGLYTSLSKAS